MKHTRRVPIAAATLALVTAPAFADAVSDASFDSEAQAISEELQRHEEVGAFGRAGDPDLPEAAPAGAVTDRDLDRYVARLAIELRLRNAIADRSESPPQ
ncbi:MAG TPA: hypothetical protein PL143_15700 [Rhodocyclaceae bacterium]|nr:hypothetical protein [Rhodocyclaceae bacterium]